jgi:hypothetical protein
MVVSFIGGENKSTWRKPLTCYKSLTNFKGKKKRGKKMFP